MVGLLKITRLLFIVLPLSQVNQEIFAALLNSLHPDAIVAGREYVRLRDKLTSFFDLRGDNDPETAADETLDRAARKVAAGTIVPEIGRYCVGIARLLFLERQRLTYRARHAFSHFTENHTDPPDESTQQRYRLMAQCLAQLPQSEQELLANYCRKNAAGREFARQRAALAQIYQTNAAGLRLRVHRLRLRLAQCVKAHQAK